MALILTDEEQALADSVRKFVADRSPLTSLRHLISSGEPFDADVWKQMTAQLGLAGLTIPEEYGGVGAGVSALSVVLTELGAGLVASPLLASVLAAEVLLRLDDSAARTQLLPRIAAGEVIATLALASSAGGHVTASRTGTSTGAGTVAGGGVTLTGSISPVLSGAEASVLLVPAETDDGTVIYLVEAEAAGLTRTRLTAVDHSRSLARVQLSETPGRALAGDANAALAAAGDLANLALASESAGAMKACLDMTSAYARIRVAFGQPIGAFQAVKHKLADMEKSWELGYAALRDAARAGDADQGRFPVAASVARVLLAGAYAEAAVDTVQLHGGIGFTWEHDAHLYYKNGLSNKVLLGGPGDQLDRLADSLGI